MLLAADLFFDFLHIFVVLFNLFGWAHARTRLAHRWLVGLTAFFWLAIGPFVGAVGYCPLTDGHWRVKEARGVTDLPHSYIDYLLRLFDIETNPQTVDVCVGATFLVVVSLTLWAWRKERRARAALH